MKSLISGSFELNSSYAMSINILIGRLKFQIYFVNSEIWRCLRRHAGTFPKNFSANVDPRNTNHNNIGNNTTYYFSKKDLPILRNFGVKYISISFFIRNHCSKYLYIAHIFSKCVCSTVETQRGRDRILRLVHIT